MKGSKSGADTTPERLSRWKKYHVSFICVIIACLFFGVYALLVNALAHDVAGKAYTSLHWFDAPSQEAVMKIDPAIKLIGPGETFSVTVKIEDAIDLGAFEFELTYNPGVVQTTTTTVALGPFLGSTGRSVGEVGPTFGAGSVTYGAYSFGDGPGPNGDGVLATITLQATSVGTSTLHLKNVVVTNTTGGPISARVEDGEVVVGTSPAPTVTNISPDWGYIGDVNNVIVMGENFQTGASVQLAQSGQSPIFASLPDVQSSTRISCTFNLGKATTGSWDVIVTNPDGWSGTLSNCFTVKNRTIYLPIVLRNY